MHILFFSEQFSSIRITRLHRIEQNRSSAVQNLASLPQSETQAVNDTKSIQYRQPLSQVRMHSFYKAIDSFRD